MENISHIRDRDTYNYTCYYCMFDNLKNDTHFIHATTNCTVYSGDDINATVTEVSEKNNVTKSIFTVEKCLLPCLKNENGENLRYVIIYYLLI